jgi:hypothetical protein
MSYIGNQPTTVAFLTDTFSGNGSTVAFTMSVAPATTTSILVAITGVVQDPSTYSVVGTTLTFSAAPPTGTGNISVRYMGIPASGVTTTAYRTVTEFTATAGQTTFSVPSYTVGYIDVYRNGSRLGAADFTATNGTTVVLAAAATAGDLIATESFYVSSVLNAIPATAGAVNSTYITDSAVTASKLASGAARSNWGAGGVLQVVNATYNTYVSTASTSFTDTGLTATITPTSATSKILVFVSLNSVNISSSSYSYDLQLAYGTGTTVKNIFNASNVPIVSPSLNIQDSPATTSATTYKVQFKVSNAAATVYLNNYASTNGGTCSAITLIEVAA